MYNIVIETNLQFEPNHSQLRRILVRALQAVNKTKGFSELDEFNLDLTPDKSQLNTCYFRIKTQKNK